MDGVNQWVNGPAADAELKGHPTLIHFWSVSCGQCKTTLPYVNEWKSNYADRGLKVVGVHMPRSESDLEFEPVQAVIRDYELTHPQAIDNDYTVIDRFENKFVPAFYVFDREGNMRHFQAGDRGMKMLQSAIERALGSEAKASSE
jgi:thiol-disulfide isomerase/thioredoxin